MSWRSLLSACVLFCLPAVAAAQVPPDKAEATFRVVDGLEIKLWASEHTAAVPHKKDPNDPNSPTVLDSTWANPTCMDIDHLGRVWVCESVNYRTKLHKKPLNRDTGDRILILEDSKGTGQADTVKVFYQSPELYGPMGIAVAKDPAGPGYKVFVCQSPDILVFTDSKGVGKADGPPKKLLSGFQGFDHDHGVHGILIGPDMKLYFSVGDQGVKNLQSSDGKGKKWTSNDTDCRAGTIWRCDMDGTNLELIAHNFRNEYEPCVDSFGTVFVSDNDDDGSQQTRICYVMPGGDYGYHPRGPGQSHWHEEQPGVVPKILRTYFGSPTGMCVYEGTLLPKKYWGTLLHTDAGPRHLRSYTLKPDGAGYDVDREDMVTSTDNWFRPSDVCVAPDGSVFIADWYDPGVGGHGMGDWTRGRIYRVAPKGNKWSVPKVDLSSDGSIVEALGSPNLAVRHIAMAKIQSMKREEAERVLLPAISQKDNPVLCARALWQYGRLIKGLGNRDDRLKMFAKLDGILTDTKDDRCRNLIMWQIWKDVDSHFLEPVYNVDNVVKKSSIANRRDTLLLTRDLDPSVARSWIYGLAKLYDGKDRFYLEAIGIAVGHHDKARREVILKDFDKEFPELNDKVLDLIWELQPPAMMATLGKHLQDAKLPAAQRGRIIDILATSDDKEAGKALFQVLQSDVPPEVRDKVLENLKRYLPGKWRELRTSMELTTTIKDLLAADTSRVKGLALIGAAEKVESLKEVNDYAANAKEALPVRQAAIATLGMLPSNDAPKALEALLKIEPAALRVDVLQALSKLAGQPNSNAPGVLGALNVLENVVHNKQNDPALRIEGVGALAGTRQGTEWLLGRAEKGDLDDAIKAEVARYLRNSAHVDLRNRALVLFPPAKIDPKKIPEIPVLAKRRGDAARGKLVFAASVKNDLQCMKCHTIRGQGGQIGPDLSMIGKKASRENLFESILYPSKAIADQYITWVIDTKKGQTITGLLVEETNVHVILRDANGKDTTIEKTQIDERKKSLKSLMPEDLLAHMTEDELLDVVEYLFTLKTPALSFDAWHIVGPFDNGENDAGLEKAFGPEKGVDLKASYDGKSGKVAWRTVKPDAQGYVDLQAFYAPNSSNIVSYLYRRIESPVDQEATILLGSDDGCKLWINGTLVHTTTQHRAAVPEEDQVKVKLKKGENTILFKINNGDGAHGFYFTIVAEQELKRLSEK